MLLLAAAVGWLATGPVLASCGDYVRVTWRLEVALSPFELPPLSALDERVAGETGQRDRGPCSGPECRGRLPWNPAPLPSSPTVGTGDRDALSALTVVGGGMVAAGSHVALSNFLFLPPGAPATLLRPPSFRERID